MRQLTGNTAIRSRSEIESQNASPLQVAYDALVIPWKVNALDPSVLFTTVYIGLVYAIFYSYFEVLPLVYLDIYHMSLGELGLIFLGCVIGTLLTLPFYYAFVHISLNKAFRCGQFPHPEHRLIPAIVGSVFIPVGLFLFAWTSRASIHWIVPTIGLVIEVSGMTLVLQCIFSYLSVAYPKYSASLFAINDLARASLAFAAILPDSPDLSGWLDSLDGNALSRLVQGAEEQRFLYLAFPKFEAEWSGSLQKILTDMGLEDAFTPGQADFSRMGDHPNGYYLSEVLHAAKLQVNEKGTEAAAATLVAPASGAPPPEQGVELLLDRPFLYGIFDRQNGVPLFLGTFE